jgi:hypothetical protein
MATRKLTAPTENFNKIWIDQIWLECRQLSIIPFLQAELGSRALDRGRELGDSQLRSLHEKMEELAAMAQDRVYKLQMHLWEIKV